MFKFSKKEKIITISVAAALAVAVAVAMVYLVNRDTVTMRGPAQISLMGETIEVDGKFRLTYREKKMYLTGNEIQDLDLLNAPVYPTKEESLTLSQVMSYTNPETGSLKKVNYFSSVEKNGNICTIKTKGRGARTVDVNGGYLFDGKNTYIFLESMMVTCGERTWRMEPLSSITVVNQNYCSYYDPAARTSEFLEIGTDKVTAANMRETYMLNLSKDLLEPANGKTQMLIPNPEVLDLIQ